MTSIQQAAIEVVQRARCGDQNAMGMLVEIGKAAKSGSPNAVQANKFAKEYIAAHPATMVRFSSFKGESQWPKMQGYVETLQAAFEGESPEDYGCCVIALLPHMGSYGITTLANGPNLNRENLREIAFGFETSQERQMFRFGVNHSMHGETITKNVSKIKEELIGPLLIGCCVGEARRVQLVRLPHVPISVYSVRAAAELGEK